MKWIKPPVKFVFAENSEEWMLVDSENSTLLFVSSTRSEEVLAEIVDCVNARKEAL